MVEYLPSKCKALSSKPCTIEKEKELHDFIHTAKITNGRDAIFFIHLFTCAYIVWAILPPPSLLLGRMCSALISNFVEEKTQAIIRKTKCFC
jgi:hypothetical protein